MSVTYHDQILTIDKFVMTEDTSMRPTDCFAARAKTILSIILVSLDGLIRYGVTYSQIKNVFAMEPKNREFCSD